MITLKILSREISEKTENLVSAIYNSLRVPVLYFPISMRPDPKDSVAGTVDPHERGGFYRVWLDEMLPQDPFEADLLHELHHIVQIEAGFSEIYCKDTPDYHSADKTFVEEVGRHLSSVVLDIEVNSWLLQCGYSYSFFTKRNYVNLLSQANHLYTGLVDPLNSANLSSALLHSSFCVDETSAANLFGAYSGYPKVSSCASALRNKLLAVNIDSPASSLFAHGLVIDAMNLWKFYYAATPDRKIRTHGEYISFAHEMGLLTDTEE